MSEHHQLQGTGEGLPFFHIPGGGESTHACFLGGAPAWPELGDEDPHPLHLRGSNATPSNPLAEKFTFSPEIVVFNLYP